MGRPNSRAIPRSINARSAYSPRLESFIVYSAVGSGGHIQPGNESTRHAGWRSRNDGYGIVSTRGRKAADRRDQPTRRNSFFPLAPARSRILTASWRWCGIDEVKSSPILVTLGGAPEQLG